MELVKEKAHWWRLYDKHLAGADGSTKRPQAQKLTPLSRLC